MNSKFIQMTAFLEKGKRFLSMEKKLIKSILFYETKCYNIFVMKLNRRGNMAYDELKRKVPIMVLSVVSLVLMIYSVISYFSCFGHNYLKDFTLEDFLDFQTIVYKISPAMMLCLYIFFIRQRKNTIKSDPIYFGIIYALLATFPIYVNIIGSKVSHPDAEGMVASIETVLVIIILITFTIVMVRALKKLDNRFCLIIATVVGLAGNAFWLTTTVKFFTSGESLYALSSLTGNIAEAMIYYAVLLYAWDYKVIEDAIFHSAESEDKK